jgi:hypothetical protein
VPIPLLDSAGSMVCSHEPSRGIQAGGGCSVGRSHHIQPESMMELLPLAPCVTLAGTRCLQHDLSTSDQTTHITSDTSKFFDESLTLLRNISSLSLQPETVRMWDNSVPAFPCLDPSQHRPVESLRTTARGRLCLPKSHHGCRTAKSNVVTAILSSSILTSSPRNC